MEQDTRDNVVEFKKTESVPAKKLALYWFPWYGGQIIIGEHIQDHGEKYLKLPRLLVIGEKQIQLYGLPGLPDRVGTTLGSYMYDVVDTTITNLYIKSTSDIQIPDGKIIVPS